MSCQYPASPSHRRALLISFVPSFTFIPKLDGAILATRYVYQLREEKREARMPRHVHLQSDSERLIPGFVRYTDSSGATVYSSHFYPPVKGHARRADAYSQINSDFDASTLYDPPSAGLRDMKSHEAQGLEDEHQDDDYKGSGYGDHDRMAPMESF